MVAIVKLGWTAGKSWRLFLAAACALGGWVFVSHLTEVELSTGGSALSAISAIHPYTAPSASRGVSSGSWVSIPLAARGPVSAALGRDQAAFRLHGFSASNPTQGLDAHFGAGAVSVRSGALRFSVGFAGIGRGDRLAFARGNVSPARSGQQVLYRRDGLTEAWNNGPGGLEQTLTIAHRPVGTAPLQLHLRIGGSGVCLMTPAGADASARAQSVTITGHDQTLLYDGLIATDALGHPLHAWLSTTGSQIVIHVDDRHAVYPIRIDPFVQQTELTASDGTTYSDFGDSVAISGHTIVIGAAGQTLGGDADAGAVYVFNEPTSGWANTTQTAELTASDPATGNNLGYSVAISGDTIVAGAIGHTVNGSADQGAVYVFTKPASGWSNATQTAELTASDAAAFSYLGYSVAISGNTIIAGAPYRTVGGNSNQGAVYVFTEPASGWANATESAKLTASDGATGGYFGWSVAISGSTIIAGALGDNDAQGAVYEFTEPASGWTDATQTAELAASDGAAGDYLGYSVAISGNAIVAGAPDRTVGGNSNQGEVYVFTEPASGWANATQAAELTSSDGTTNDYFGTSVALSGDTIVAGALLHTVGGKDGQGAIYVFTKPAAGWTSAIQNTELTASDGARYDSFGGSVTISGNTIVTGAGARTVSGKSGQGAAYLFAEPATSTLAATLNAVNIGATGTSIAVAPASPVSATATLSGVDATAATGSVAYNIYSDQACTQLMSAGTVEPITSPGTLPASQTVSLTHTGTYYWQISYSGDESNLAAKSACGALIENVVAPTGRATITIPKGTVAGTTLTLPVRCSTAGPCTLKFALTYRTVTVASASLMLRPGKSTKLKLTLNNSGRQLLRHRSPLHTTLTITQAGRKIVSATVSFRHA